MFNQNARINMVKQQLRTGDVLSEKVLALFEELPREDFLPEAMKPFAYSDMQIPLGHGQRMLTPLEEGRMLQALNLSGNETVLETGTGSGYFTALLSRLCKKVISVEYFQDFSQEARKRLRQQHCDNVELITGDGHRGWLENAPYDVMIFTGAVEKITQTMRLQIVPGGKLLAITGQEPIMQCKLLTLDHMDNWKETFLFETSIPPLIDKYKRETFVF